MVTFSVWVYYKPLNSLFFNLCLQTKGKYPALNPGEEDLLKMTMNFWSLYRDGVSAAMAKEPAEISKTMRPIKKTNPFVVIKKKLQEISLNVPAYQNNDSSSDSTAAMRSRMGHLIALSQLHLVNSF